MTAVFVRFAYLELVIMFARHKPDLKRDARSVRTKCIVVADIIDDAVFLTNFLTEDVAENAALVIAEPFSGGTQFIKNAPGYKDSGGQLGVGVGPFLAGLCAAVLEYGDVLKARIAFQIGNPRSPCIENEFYFVIAQIGEMTRMIGSLNYDLVRADGSHFIVDAFSAPAGVAFDVVEGAEVRIYTHLRGAGERQFEQNLRINLSIGAKRTRARARLLAFAMADNNPTARDGILAEFHTEN